MDIDNKHKKINLCMLIAVILLFGTFDTINLYKIPSIYESIANVFELSSQDVSWFLACYSITATIMALPAGFLADKFGTKKIIFFGVCVSAFGSVLGAISFEFLNGNIYVLCLSRILEGLCYIFASVCMPVFICQVVGRKHAGFAIGFWAIRTNLACVIGEAFTPLLVGATSFAITWLIYCGLMLIAAIILFKTTKFSNGYFQSTKIEQRNGKVFTSGILPAILFFVSFLLFAIIQSSVLDYTPVILQNRFNMDESISGLYTSTPMMVSVVTSLIFGYLVDKAKTYKYLYTLGVFLVIPGAIIMVNCQMPWFLIGAIIMAIGLAAPAISACAVFEIFKEPYYGIGIGIGMTVFSLGQFLGARFTQTIIGNNFQSTDLLTISFIVIGAIALMCSLFVKIKIPNNKV